MSKADATGWRFVANLAGAMTSMRLDGDAVAVTVDGDMISASIERRSDGRGKAQAGYSLTAAEAASIPDPEGAAHEAVVDMLRELNRLQPRIALDLWT